MPCNRFGGIPRKEAVTITSRASPDAQIDLKLSMDALAHAIAPLYDNLTMETTVGGAKTEKLGNVIFSQDSCCTFLLNYFLEL
jgi:patched 2 protein